MLELSGVRQAYAGRTVLSIDSLLLEPGRRLAVVGPNGSGKSTLLRLLALLEVPARGEVRFEGRPLRTETERRGVRRRITLVEQRPFLFRGSVLENVAWGLRARGVTRAEAERDARAALGQLASEWLAGRDARALSEGEVQRVAVARSLATGPNVLLLDEPVSGADRAAQQALYMAISRAQEGRPLAVCVASHQLEEAYRWADRMLALHDGTPTPVTPENLFRVELPGGADIQRVTLGSTILEVPTSRSGPVTLGIPPDEIVLSALPLQSSARNAVRGRIVRITEHGAAVRVTLEGDIELIALITRRSMEELDLKVGTTAWASFKSVAIRVF